MKDIDYIAIERSIEEYKKYVNSKHWADLTENELEYVCDKEKLKKRKKYINVYIIPLLYSMKNNSHFKFSHPNNQLTCRNMRDDVVSYYKKLGYNQQDLYQICSEKNINKY